MKFVIVLASSLLLYNLCYCQKTNTAPWKVLKGHKYKVQNAFYSPNGNFIVSHGWDNTVRIWDAKSYSQTKVLKGHTDQVWCVSVSPDNKLIASGSMDRSFIIWEVETGNCLQKIQITPINVVSKGIYPEFDSCLPNSVYSLSFSPNNKFLAVATADKLVRIWDITNSTFIDTLSGHSSNWMWTQYSPDGKYIITGSRYQWPDKGETIVWDAITLDQIFQIKTTGDIMFNSNGDLGVYNDECKMDFYDIENGELIISETFPCAKGYFKKSIDGKYIVSCNEDYYIKLWELKTGKIIWKYKGKKMEIHHANFSPNGNCLIAGTPESDILIWRLKDIVK